MKTELNIDTELKTSYFTYWYFLLHHWLWYMTFRALNSNNLTNTVIIKAVNGAKPFRSHNVLCNVSNAANQSHYFLFSHWIIHCKNERIWPRWPPWMWVQKIWFLFIALFDILQEFIIKRKKNLCFQMFSTLFYTSPFK